MASKSQTEPTPKTLKQCVCGATVFQGPFPVGEIDGAGEMHVRRNEYRCVRCNKVQELESMIDVTIPSVVL